MKNKKVIIGILFVLLIIVAIAFGVYRARYNENYLYNEDGTIAESDIEGLKNNLRGIEDAEQRKQMINFCVEHHMLTQDEANELY